MKSEVNSVYSLEGNPLTLALQIMMSGLGGDPAYENISVSQFVQNGLVSGTTSNSIFFREVNISKEYNLQLGDKITISGAINGANNFTDRNIIAIESNLRGSTIVVDGPSLILELESTAIASFRSQYDVLPSGAKMLPDEVDIEQHIFIRDFFHPSTQFRLLIDDDIDNIKDFLDKEIYKPVACYALPRKAKSSVGYSIGPIPGADIKTLNINNVKDPKSIGIKRTVNRAFFNEVSYKYDKSPISDKYLSLYVEIAQDSKNRILGGNRTYKVESKGLQTDLNAANIVASEAQRFFLCNSFLGIITNQTFWQFYTFHHLVTGKEITVFNKT